jgi:hypothetical protein
MQARATAIRTALMLSFVGSTPVAHSVMYRWIDQDGGTTYSDQMPSDPSRVRALTVIDTPRPPSHLEKRSRQLIDGQRTGQAPDSAAMLYESTARETSTLDSEMPTASELRGGPRISGIPDGRPQAARDPCLRSSDPRCYEKNRDSYIPYLGYVPGVPRPARSADALAPIGATSGEGVSGAIGGAFSVAPRPAPTRRPQVWQPRQSLRDAKDLK